MSDNMYLLISFYSSLQIPRLVTNETNGGRCRSVVEARRKERPPSFEGAPQGQRGCLRTFRGRKKVVRSPRRS